MSTAHLISDMSSISIDIGGKPLPPMTNFIDEFVLYSGFGFTTPVLVIQFSDSHNVLTGAQAVNDGTIIDITFGKTDFNTKQSYLVTSVKETKSIATVIKATCILNSPQYSFGSQSEAHRGTSAQAIKSIIERCGMRFETDTKPVDSMNWLNVGKSRAKHVADIMNHSYQSDSSCLYGLLDLEGIFRYRDLFKLLEEPKFVVFVGEQQDTNLKAYLASEAKPQAISGLMNLLANYGNVSIVPKLDGEIDRHEKVKPPVFGDGLPINQSVQESMKYSRMEQAPYYDPGVGSIGGSNAHEKYYESQYQNNRFLALFNQCVRVLIQGETDMRLFDTVDLRVSSTHGTESSVDRASSGLYFVGGRTIVKRGMHYVEIFDLYRCYITESGNTPIIGSKNQVASSGKPEFDEVKSSSVNIDDPRGAADIGKQVGDKVKALQETQINGEFAPPPTVTNALDQFVNKTMKSIDELESQFRTEAQELGGDELAEKYGQGKDKLNSLMDEFGAAKSTLEQCGKLNPLESLSLKLAKTNIRKLLDAVTSRIDRVDALANSVQSELNNLIARGDISGELIDKPDIRTNCKQFQTDHIEAGIADRYPDKCIDQYSLDRLRFPLDLLRRLKRKLENYLRNLFCMIGEDS